MKMNSQEVVESLRLKGHEIKSGDVIVVEVEPDPNNYGYYLFVFELIFQGLRSIEADLKYARELEQDSTDYLSIYID